MATELAAAKAIRTSVRKIVTRYVNEGQTLINANSTEYEKLRDISEKLTPKIALLNTNHDEIVDILPVDEIEKAFDSHDGYVKKVEDIQWQICTYLKANSPTVPAPGNPSPTHVNNNIKLPKLSLPKFSGNLLEWSNFWDSFTNSVHSKTTISNIEKFTYLKSCLTGPALSSISGFTSGGESYNHAVDILKERFGQSRRLITAYMDALIEMKKPVHTVSSLRSFYDNLNMYVRSLEALNKSSDSYGDLLIPVLLKKLPATVVQNISRGRSVKDWTLNALLQSLSNELDLLETCSQSVTEPVNDLQAFTTQTESRTSGRNPTSGRRYPFSKRNCSYCGDRNHASVNCDKMKTIDDRMKIVSEKRLCKNCLRPGHIAVKCFSQTRCKRCSKQHHTSLCQETVVQNPQNSSSSRSESSEASNKSTSSTNAHVQLPEASPNGTSPKTIVNGVVDAQPKQLASNNSVLNKSNSILLKTAVLNVSSGSISTETNALFDDGSMRTFITKSLVDRLELNSIRSEVVNISGFGSADDVTKSDGRLRSLSVVKLGVLCDDDSVCHIEALVVPNITRSIYTGDRSEIESCECFHGIKLAHPVDKCDYFGVDLLIGTDNYYHFILDETIRCDHIRDSRLTAVKTRVGYIVSGPLSDSMSSTFLVTMLTDVDDDEFDLGQFWSLETLGIEHPDAADSSAKSGLDLDEYCTSSIRIDEDDGRYVARLPWKKVHGSLPTNYGVCFGRTQSTVRRLVKHDMIGVYAKIFEEQLQRGFIEVVPDARPDDPNSHYIPHHPVFRKSATTPVRVVYDCSCKSSKDSCSLNECLEPGPALHNSITSMLLRFRMHQFGVVSDIEKAFLMIRLHDDDKDFTRFLWLKDPSDPASGFVTMRFRVILFGSTSSPFILNATILKHLKLDASETSEKIMDNIYVDNVITSIQDEEKLEQFYKTSREVLQLVDSTCGPGVVILNI